MIEPLSKFPAPCCLLSAGKGAAANSSQAAAPNPKNISKNTRAVLNRAINSALAECTLARHDIALMLAVAKFGCAGSGSSKNCQSTILETIRVLDFERALSLCKEMPRCDLSAAFAELMARTFDASNGGISDLRPVAMAIHARGGALDLALVEAFDYDAYFASIPKQARHGIAGEIELPGFKPAAKRSAGAAALASHARYKNWLPRPLSTWISMAARLPDDPLAECTNSAIMADAKTEDHRDVV